MAKKPTYEELEKRVKELEKETFDRKQAEEALRESEEKFRNLFNNVEIGMFRTRLDGSEILDMNEKFLNIFGRTREEMQGLPSVIHWADPSEREEMMRMLEIEGRVPNFECKMLNKQGEVRTCLASSRLYRDQGIMEGSIMDITARNQAEVALRKSEERFRTVADFTYDWEYWIAPDGQYIYVSPSCERISGYSPEEFMTDPGLFERIVHPDDHSGVVGHIQGEQNQEELCLIDFRIITRSGEERWINHNCQPIRGIDGMHLGRRGSNRDISKRKKMEEEVLKAKKLESLGVLAGGIAHQFNNALGSITGHTGLLEMDYPEDAKIMDYTKAMKQSAHRMARLTSQLLAYARGGKYNPQPISLSELVEGALPSIQHNLDPAVRMESDLPPDLLNVKVDRTQMQMVLSAIVANSNEAIEPPGRIRISTKNIEIDHGFIKDHPGLKPGPHVCLSIEDDGKGMDEETKERIFEPFFTTHFIGRGLGMPAAYGIVTNHSGIVSVDSEPGKGTAVTIYLPALEAREEVEEEVEEKIVSAPVIDLPTGEGTILIIEDEEVLVELFRKILEMLGYRVLEAKTGEDAVELANTFDGRIDLALLDIKLPDMDGGSVYPLIMEARPDLKVIVCSGYSIDGPAQKILDAGAEGFIQKPFLIAALAEKLKEVLEGK